MKSKITKILRKITILSIAFTCGLFIFVGVMSVYADLNSSTDGVLYKTEYEDLVKQVKSWTRINPSTNNIVKLGDNVNGVNMNGKKITNLLATTDNSDNSEAVTKIYVDSKHAYKSGTDSIAGLTADKKYLVTVYGVTTNRGKGSATLGNVAVRSSSRTLDSTPQASINWPDGCYPQSAWFVIAAPSDGTIYGFTDYKSSTDNVPATKMIAIAL